MLCGSQPYRNGDHRGGLWKCRRSGASFRTTTGTDEWHIAIPGGPRVAGVAGTEQCTAAPAANRDPAQNSRISIGSKTAIRAVGTTDRAGHSGLRHIAPEGYRIHFCGSRPGWATGIQCLPRRPARQTQTQSVIDFRVSLDNVQATFFVLPDCRPKIIHSLPKDLQAQGDERSGVTYRRQLTSSASIWRVY